MTIQLPDGPTVQQILETLAKAPDALEKVNGILKRSGEILRKTQAWIERLIAVFGHELPAHLSELHNSLLAKVQVLSELLSTLSSPLQTYNEKAQDFNQGLERVQKHELGVLSSGLLAEILENEEEVEAVMSAGKTAAEKIEEQFTEEQKEEIRAFAELLWHELFPETHVDRFTKWATGQKDLENYQEIILAPANGIEGVLSGVWDLAAHPIQSYEDMREAVQLVSGMSYEDFCSCVKVLKFMYREMDKKELVAPSISFIAGTLFIFGGAAKVSKLLGGRQLPAALVDLTGSLGRANNKSQSLARAKDMPTQLLEEIDAQAILEDLQEED
ncbi:MAG: hypothetical protein WC777_02720 [Candidatus Gracilibacteria bacterium]|jgi:hypothetical protein